MYLRNYSSCHVLFSSFASISLQCRVIIVKTPWMEVEKLTKNLIASFTNFCVIYQFASFTLIASNTVSLKQQGSCSNLCSHQPLYLTMSNFTTHLDLHKKFFHDVSLILIKRFVASLVDKIHNLRLAKLSELEASWLNNVYNSYSCKPF